MITVTTMVMLIFAFITFFVISIYLTMLNSIVISFDDHVQHHSGCYT